MHTKPLCYIFARVVSHKHDEIEIKKKLSLFFKSTMILKAIYTSLPDHYRIAHVN